MRALRITSVVLLVLVAGAAATWWAGEQTELVVIRTLDGDGTQYHTKVWVVDHDGAPWVRVANPGRFWFHRLSRNPHAPLIRGGVEQPVIARPADFVEARAAIDARFREKYGVVDWWYGVLLRHNAIPVRLDPDREGAR
jgi:Uncharacterized protein conserved in bacteria (DUF2255)